jgi:hypothetical protein
LALLRKCLLELRQREATLEQSIELPPDPAHLLAPRYVKPAGPSAADAMRRPPSGSTPVVHASQPLIPS